MQYIPFEFRVTKAPCENFFCQRTDYVAPYTGRENVERYVVCNLHCYFSKRYQVKFKYHIHTAVPEGKYDVQRRKRT